MTSAPRNDLIHELQNRLLLEGRAADELLRTTSAIIGFGSRAALVNRQNSDLDILCISRERHVLRSHLIDCVWLSAPEAEHSLWLGSELAGHIASFGVSLHGEWEWRTAVNVSSRAQDRKVVRVSSLLRNMSARWAALTPVFQAKYAITLRRELQRLNILMKRSPVPPTPALDSEWRQSGVLLEDYVDSQDFDSETRQLGHRLLQVWAKHPFGAGVLGSDWYSRGPRPTAAGHTPAS